MELDQTFKEETDEIVIVDDADLGAHDAKNLEASSNERIDGSSGGGDDDGY